MRPKTGIYKRQDRPGQANNRILSELSWSLISAKNVDLAGFSLQIT